MSLVATFRNFNEDYNPENLITESNILIHNKGSSYTYNPNSIFSPKIFGEYKENYTCKCGHLKGKFYDGITCSKCDTIVKKDDSEISDEGWIDLHEKFISPLIWRYIRKIIGNVQLTNILDYKPNAAKYTYPLKHVGYNYLIDNLFDILKICIDKKGKYKKEYDIILNNTEYMFIDKLAIPNTKLRPAIIVGDEFVFDVENNIYINIIELCNTLKNQNEIEIDSILTHKIRSDIQLHINELYEKIVSKISNKKGFIRSNLIGNRLNFSARAVIVPISNKFNVDEISIPYIAAVELFKPLLIQSLINLKNISIIEAYELIIGATKKFDPIIFNILNGYIKHDDKCRILLNRNPTLALGSILRLRIAEIKEDINDYTFSIHNLTLKHYNGDYDGDCLNLFMLFGKEFVNLYERFDPYNLGISSVSYSLNRNFTFAKDVMLGLNNLI